MSKLSKSVGASLYRGAASLSARILAGSPIVKSVVLHRSAATGEISFCRSDIDLLLVIDQEQVDDAARVAGLYRALCRARWLNPALGHVDVYDQGTIAAQARTDTVWASVERRSQLLLRGRPVDIPCTPVQADHALARFLLWVEWFFAISVQQRNRRNLKKLSLESWNAYALADGTMREPCVLRREMETHLRIAEPVVEPDRLEEPSYAVKFVLGLGERLHRSRLPALRKLDKPLIFEAITSPLCLPRVFVVLPRADSPLPPESFRKGAFLCTPEVLDLAVRYKNAFLYWVLPQELIDLGIEPPAVTTFLGSCLHFCQSRFLLHPGFATPGPATHAARLNIIRQAMEGISRDGLPPPVAQTEIREMMAAGVPVADYYRTEYAKLRRVSLELEESLRTLLKQTAA